MPTAKKPIDREQVKTGFELAIQLLGPIAVQLLAEKTEAERDPRMKAVYKGATNLAKWAEEHPREAVEGGETVYELVATISKKSRQR